MTTAKTARAQQLLIPSSPLREVGSGPGIIGNPQSSALSAADTAHAAAISHPKRPGRSALEVFLLNVGVNRFDDWVLGHEWAMVRPRHWERNLRLGWEWDEDEFLGNMFAHPFHGSLYFIAGRSNQLDFWESVPLAFFGSWLWEYFGEVKRPSLNDFFMTSFGGIALGEVLHRLGTSIRDNTLDGRARQWREIAAFPVDPMGGVNRLINGEWSKQGPNPAEHSPEAFLLRAGFGVRLADPGITDQSQALAPSSTAILDLTYGDPFVKAYEDPFDVFAVRLQMSPGGGDLNLVRASGRLFGFSLNGSAARHRHIIAVNQRYDYLRNPAHQFGAQTVEGGVYSRWAIGRRAALRTQVFGGAVILGALDAPLSGQGDRNYDFGPGLGFRLHAALEIGGITWAQIEARTDYIRSVSGAAANHNVSMGGFEINIPITRAIGAGFQSGYYNRLSRYLDNVDEARESPEFRINLIWTPTARTNLGRVER